MARLPAKSSVLAEAGASYHEALRFMIAVGPARLPFPGGATEVCAASRTRRVLLPRLACKEYKVYGSPRYQRNKLTSPGETGKMSSTS